MTLLVRQKVDLTAAGELDEAGHAGEVCGTGINDRWGTNGSSAVVLDVDDEGVGAIIRDEGELLLDLAAFRGLEE